MEMCYEQNRKIMMKSLMVFTVLLWASAGLLITETKAQSKADEEAIKSVLLAETDLFFARDYQGWAATFVHVSNATQVWNNSDGSYTHRVGWDIISARIEAFMKSNPKPDTTPLWRENFNIRHYGDAAFVTFDKYMGDRETAKPIREIRVVERQGDAWKIVCVVAFIDHLKATQTGG
jgi:hypothetical protein